jgi:uncharacterized protein
MKIVGFDWDDGNWPKCAKHGVSQIEIEEAIRNVKFVVPDPNIDEPRFRAVGKTELGRYVFVAYTLRSRDILTFIRPISARYMHKKEIQDYERNER